jgi:hypothetical protein
MLFYLFMEVNGQFHQEKRTLYFQVVLLLHSVRDCFRDALTLRWDDTLERLRSAVDELYGWQRAVAILAERYFQGIGPLLPETEEQLGWIVAQGERVVDIFNDRLEFEGIARKASGKRTPPLPKPLDLETLKQAAEPRAKAQVGYLLALARAQACDMMGERKRGLAYIERHIAKAV